MHVFLTGASGYVGGAVAAALVAAGHRVSALARTDVAIERVRARGAEPVRGDLADGRVVQAAAARADAVVHAAVDYARPDFGDVDEVALSALLAGARGRDVPFVFTSTTLVHGAPEVQPFKVAGERRVLSADGVRATVVRPGLVHGHGGSALLQAQIAGARDHGVATYVGDGAARWSAVHVDDVAALYVAVLAGDAAGLAIDAVADDAPSMREVAEAIGELVGVPTTSLEREDAIEAMGPLAIALGRDLVGDAGVARERLGWRPREATLLDDLRSYPVPAA